VAEPCSAQSLGGGLPDILATLTKQCTILNVCKKKRRSLYDALADVEALAPAKALYEDGLPGMEAEFACYAVRT